jgi:hypothetical protein
MRTTSEPRSRCGDTIMARDSILEVQAGKLAKRHDEPWIDPCADRLEEWFVSGRWSPVSGLRASPQGSAVESGVMAGR